MKRSAFTLIELLVVVAILGLLLAILAPQLTAARNLARAAVCQHQLKQIGTAFRAAQASPSNSSKDGAPRLYPAWVNWPDIPACSLPDRRIFICPETDANTAGATCDLRGLKYRNAGRPEIEADLTSVPNPYIYKYGPDEPAHNFPPGGTQFTYYILEDNIASGGNANATSDINDGLFRVNYDTGNLELLYYSCGETNQLYSNDQPVQWTMPDGSANSGGNRLPPFSGGPPYPVLHLGDGKSNYGINSVVNTTTVAGDTVVVLDFRLLVADSTPSDATLQRLRDNLFDRSSARHRGKLNILYADEAVRVKGPSELDPLINLDQWTP